jgi:putative aldouronate transport system substrate-binding protein
MSVGRRTFLRGAGSTALAAVGGSILAACGSDDDSGAGPTGSSTTTAAASGATETATSRGSASASSPSGTSLIPSYIPSSKITPDLPATDVVPPGFLAYPANPVAVSSGTPGKGGSVSATLLATEGLPPAEGKNPFWQALNKKLGVELKIDYATSSGYASKVQTTIAGGSVPDFLQLTTSVPQLSGVLAAEFQDLSEFLSGDAIKAYPSLAAIPAFTWQNVVIGGGLYGVPYPQPAIPNIVMARADILAAKGLTADALKTGQDFLDLCKELTDVKRNKWAIGTSVSALVPVQQMVGVPNIWRVEDGKFISQYETDEYTQSLDIVAGMWKDGVINPDGFASTANPKQWFGSGTSAIVKDGWSAWSSYLQTYQSTNPEMKIGGLVLPKWDGGGQAGVWAGSGMYTFTALKKSNDKSRIQGLLALLDWLASPFGSEEYLFRRYGIADRDYTLNGTDPVPTETGSNEVGHMVLSYLATIPPVIYNPGQPDATRDLSGYLKKLSAAVVPYPIAGLFSPTKLTKGSTIEKNIADLQSDILQGRKSVKDWAAGVKAWRSGGGDQIRKEYEEAYAAAHR